MAASVKPIPDGFHTVTPHKVVRNAPEAIEFYGKAFGAEEVVRVSGPDGKSVMHAEVQIGDTRLMIGSEYPGPGAKAPETVKGTTITVHMYVPDVDRSFDRAVAAGATAMMQPRDMFWGDRMGKVADPFGHHWSIATHIKDLTPEEMGKGAAEFFANAPC